MSAHNGIPRGLAGKARRAHARSRSSRLYAQQLISEYFETDPYERRLDRAIPIRRRNDFVPSAWESGDTSVTGDQSYLEYSPAPPTVQTERTGGKQDLLTDVDSNVMRPLRMSPSAKPKPETASTSFKPLGISPLVGKSERVRWRLSGLLSGCAIGGAMAAAILLLLSLFVE